MAMKVSSTRTSPFKTSFPPILWNLSSCLHSSSMPPGSFWASSRNALHRYFQFNQGSSYSTISLDENSKHDEMELHLQSTRWKLEVPKGASNPHVPFARMVPDLPNQISSKGNSLSGDLSSLRRLGEENKQGDSCLTTREKALQKSFGQVYKGDEKTSLHVYRPSHKASNECYVQSEGNTGLVPGLISEELASTSADVNLTGNNNTFSELPLKNYSNSEPQSNALNGDRRSSRGEWNSVHHSDPHKRLDHIYDKVLVVDNIPLARKTVRMLTNQYRHYVYACDTEVANIDVKQETPVDHGEIICFTIFSGPEANFGDGQSCIWVDVLDGSGKSLLDVFAPFFEDPSIKKVWHNYSFHKHVIENHGLKVSGFHADVMYMARLWDSSRWTEGGHSLVALTGDPKLGRDEKLIGKVSTETIFGRRKAKKDGSEGKIITIPPVQQLQREERKLWISYSALHPVGTLKLYENLESVLSQMEWRLDGRIKGSMSDFYEKYLRPFSELLIQMETDGMLVDRAYLAEMEKVAREEQQVAADRFRGWASRYCPDAKYMNVGSDDQLRQLLFGGTQNRNNPNESLPRMREFKVPNFEKVIEKGKKAPSKIRSIKLHRLVPRIETEIYTATGWPSVSGDALKILAGKVYEESYFTTESSPLHSEYNVGNLPETQLFGAKVGVVGEGSESAYGTAYAAFGGGQDGKEACHAIAALCESFSIDSLISNFILPLQGSHISGKNGRIHCSLHISTETGRLSTRRPNLQNLPALDKDRYGICQAFIAAPGNSLIVADYDQLELRILAHLSDCKSMLQAFKAGVDFHSRTAMDMYPYICDAIEQNHVLLEWHPQPGEEKPLVPLLKDAFASERRKAKKLNFAIAYGITPVGLARDWKVSVKEATGMVNRWYKERLEVWDWQHKCKEVFSKTRCVHTLLGRAHRFPLMDHAKPSQKAHFERAAINTLVQGSAADVAMCAMLEISKNARLKELGWRLLLQVHDEVILEGPTDSAKEAKAIVVECMSKPFDGKNILKVDLPVAAKYAKNWYSAK